MKRNNQTSLIDVLIIVFAVLLMVTIAVCAKPREAQCKDCIPTLCGHESECPMGCGCYIPPYEAVGYCY